MEKLLDSPHPWTISKFFIECNRILRQRGKKRDQKTERSMEKVAANFSTAENLPLSELQGWHFMLDLKRVRMVNGAFDPDDYLDIACYAFLAYEAAAKAAKNSGKK